MTEPQDKPLHTLGLIEVVQGIASGRFTAEAYTQALLARIAILDEKIQAWAWLKPEAALQAAHRCDENRQRGTTGPLLGLPIGVKDIYTTAGLPTEMGSPAFIGHLPKTSARVVERLETRGAFVTGKTVTTECAFLSPGKTRNPWNPRHTPGGSSSGSAAAVAARFIPAALGTQTNGSVIRPAAFCGVVGFKPTQGLIPIEGALTFSHTLDQPGLFTRSVADMAWLAAALCEGVGKPDALLRRSSPPRLAVLKTPVWDLAEEPAKQRFLDNIRILREGGAVVEERELPAAFDRAHEAVRTIMSVESAHHLEELFVKKAPLLSSTLRDFITEGRAVAAVDYLQALQLRLQLQEELERFLIPFDAAITLPATGEAPDSLEQTGSPAFCTIWSLCGVPAVTIPVGLGPRGLPLGLQVVGARGKDSQVLAAAGWCEGLFPFSPWEG
jgi:Asp-tRNA(Asn)/Glu-tRNA(Gln) amidotransferase A subunit family amidase